MALAAEQAKFDNVKVGYDNNSDDDIDDAGDDLIVNETFGSTTITPAYDDNGNLTDDGSYKYTYDPWNRLVKVTAKQDTDITVQTARYDPLGRRLRKIVTNSGDYDGTVVYYYYGHRIIETRDGSGNLLMQVYGGTQYIDEVIGLRLEHGRAYVHQDANWNVTGLTDLKGAVLERNYYSPYGQVEVAAETYFGDYDGNGLVDADDADDLCSNGGGCGASTSSRRLEQRRPDTIHARSSVSAEINRVRGQHQPRIAFGIRDDALGCGRFVSADALGWCCQYSRLSSAGASL